tara:strand:+ start:358 stop:1770 length:1413 start_codon:yes stop_codon:yes gene_type:complete
VSSKAAQYQDALGALVQSFVNAFGGTKGVREVIQKSNAPRSPIQDVMNQERALRMGVEEIPTVPGQAPVPEGFGGFGPSPDAPTSKVPLQRSPIGTEGRTRPAPKRAEFTPVEAIEVEGQLRIPYTQPGKGGQMYSPTKSIENPEVVADSMRQRLGEIMDAVDFPRYKGAEGQFGMDLEPDVTREMMRRMAPAMSQAPSVPDPLRPMGVQMVDLSSVDPKTLQRGLGLAMLGAAGLAKEEMVDAPARFQEQQEVAAENKLISDVLASVSQQGGALAEVVMRNAPRSPENYSSLEKYNQARSEFLENLKSVDGRPSRFQQAADLIEQYRAQQAAPQSQQTGEAVTTTRLVAEAGSNDAANVAGNIAYGSESDVTGPPAGPVLDGTAERQGASELSQFTQARPQPELRMASTAMMQSIQADNERRLAAEADARNQAYIAARAGLGSNPSSDQTAAVEDLGLELFRENFPQFR